jgi:hypothetical protein
MVARAKCARTFGGRRGFVATVDRPGTLLTSVSGVRERAI